MSNESEKKLLNPFFNFPAMSVEAALREYEAILIERQREFEKANARLKAIQTGEQHDEN